MTNRRETDSELADRSSEFLGTVREMRNLENRKREAGRSTEEFHDLAQQIVDKSRLAFRQAQEQHDVGEQDSPDPRERDEQYPGDWTRSASH